MRLDRPWAKFCLKSYLNCRLIDFLDMNNAAGLTCRDNTIQIRTINSILNPNLIKNISNLIRYGQSQSKMSKSIENSVLLSIFDQIWYFLNKIWYIFDEIQLNNRHKDDYFWSFNQKMISNLSLELQSSS